MAQGRPTEICHDNNRDNWVQQGALIVWIDTFLFKRHPELKEVPCDCVSAGHVCAD